MICKECGNDEHQPKTQELIDAIRSAGGLVSEMCDPGGRALSFGNGLSLRVSDWCNACDHAHIIKTILEYNKGDTHE